MNGLVILSLLESITILAYCNLEASSSLSKISLGKFIGLVGKLGSINLRFEKEEVLGCIKGGKSLVRSFTWGGLSVDRPAMNDVKKIPSGRSRVLLLKKDICFREYFDLFGVS